MIITQTPLRISFAGGGTDFHDYYRKNGGCVLSSAIDKYVYVIVKERFDNNIRVGYSKTEMVDDVDQIEHELVRECLRKTGIGKGIEISTMADIPSEGSGLGSSSTVTVGLLNALYAYKGEMKPTEILAQEACEIEIDILGKPIGKQDQYIAAFGGIRHITFNKDDTVSTERIELADDKVRRLSECLLLFYTGMTRSASAVLTEQKANISDKEKVLTQMKDLCTDIKYCLFNGGGNRFGEILHKGWEMKKTLARNISNSGIDDLYRKALDGGAIGGKIAGAGAGGFLLLYCPPENQASLREALSELKELPFNLERDGTKVIFNVRR
ncbi:MAG: GHMP kinase [Patescibacteria group bacterium]|nr:GHMP kinase [Patescibacteria group bacterium]